MIQCTHMYMNPEAGRGERKLPDLGRAERFIAPHLSPSELELVLEGLGIVLESRQIAVVAFEQDYNRNGTSDLEKANTTYRDLKLAHSEAIDLHARLSR